MPIERCCETSAIPEHGGRAARAVAVILVMALAGCAAPWQPAPPPQPAAPSAAAQAAPAPAAEPAPAPAEPAPPTPLPFDEAVLKAADALLAGARPAAGQPARRPLVIDPLIDGVTGFQAAATRSMESRIVDLVRSRHPHLEVREFTTASLAEGPLVLVGSLTGVDQAGRVQPRPEAYRIWLVLADLKSGKIVEKGTAHAIPQGVDLTPAAFFNDSPGWARDRYVDAYLRTCAGKAGDPIDPAYLEGIGTAALIGDAIEAYDAGRYEEALGLYQRAASTPAGNQLRVHNGLYLANWRLGRHEEAAAAFARLVDYGLASRNLSIRFLFRPGTTELAAVGLAQPYDMWLEQLARGSARRSACLEVTGHTSSTGAASRNEQLSVQRAEQIRSMLAARAPELDGRTIASGAGSRENIVGTGRDDATDALDRRVEFEVLGC